MVKGIQGNGRGYQLAIFAPYIGLRSETFIQRHMQDLLPGGTVVVANNVGEPFGGHWSVDGPLLVLNRIQEGNLKRLSRVVTRKFGLRTSDRLGIAMKFLYEHDVQVIMGEFLDVSFPWLQIAKELGARFYAHAHGYDISVRLRDPTWRDNYARYSEASGVITVSQVSRQRLLQLGLDPNKVHVVPCGVEIPAESSRRDVQGIVRCLAVGRMVAKKSPILTLDAFRQAALVYQGLRLDFIGSGALFSTAQQYVDEFNLSDRVILHGDQPNEIVHKMMREADIFLQHSRTDPETGDEEGLPVAILEAMAQGLPVISTYHAGIPEAVFDGETGLLTEEGDCKGMTERILSLSRDPELRYRMGNAGWHRAKKQFSWEKERAELIRILDLSS